MSREMIERVARALEEELRKSAVTSGNVIVLSGGAKLEDAARAAIAAMREPTEFVRFSGEKMTMDAISTWQTMIDAALAE